MVCGETERGSALSGPGLVEEIDPPISGWRSTIEPWDIDGSSIRLATTARRLQVSSVSYLALFMLACAIDYLLDIGVETILAHDLRLARVLADGLDALGAQVVTPREEAHRAGIVAARFPARRARGSKPSARSGRHGLGAPRRCSLRTPLLQRRDRCRPRPRAAR